MKQNILGRIIKDIRKAKKITQKQLSEITGYSQNTISNHENGNRSLKENDIKKYATALGVTPEQLFEAVDINYSIENRIMIIDKKQTYIDNTLDIMNELQEPRQKKVYSFAEKQLEEQNKPERKIYNLGTTAAGSALDYGDDFVEEEKLESIPKNADFVLTIKGSSMEPKIKDGSKVFVQSTSNIENGEIAIVEINDEAVTCKKVKFDYDNKKIVLESLNPEYKDMEFDNDQVRILGRVVK